MGLLLSLRLIYWGVRRALILWPKGLGLLWPKGLGLLLGFVDGHGASAGHGR